MNSVFAFILRFSPVLVIVTLVMSSGCDKERRDKCEWYLVPDESRLGKTDVEYIPVCARNYVSNKQDCRLQTTLKFAEKVYKLKFRYIDLKVSDFGKPRTIKEIKFCES